MIETIDAVITEDEPKVDTQGRKILDEGRWRDLILRYESSGLTQVQYARREGIKYHTFVARLGRHRRGGPKKVVRAKFLEARLPSAPTPRLEATLPCGVLVRGDSPEALARLIRALQA
jgi:hypothetical protein